MAVQHGYEISSRGRIPADIEHAFADATDNRSGAGRPPTAASPGRLDPNPSSALPPVLLLMPPGPAHPCPRAQTVSTASVRAPDHDERPVRPAAGVTPWELGVEVGKWHWAGDSAEHDLARRRSAHLQSRTARRAPGHQHCLRTPAHVHGPKAPGSARRRGRVRVRRRAPCPGPRRISTAARSSWRPGAPARVGPWPPRSDHQRPRPCASTHRSSRGSTGRRRGVR